VAQAAPNLLRESKGPLVAFCPFHLVTGRFPAQPSQASTKNQLTANLTAKPADSGGSP
jgi:hypothetical protein